MDRMTKGMQRAWTPEERDRLARFYADRLDTAYIARLLGRSAHSIDSKARALGIVRDPSRRKTHIGSQARNRRCMRCGMMFASWGIGNRMCGRCKRVPPG